MSIRNKIRPLLSLLQKNKTEMSENRSKQVGDYGQSLAKDFLLQRDYEILSENYYSSTGEIDIVSKKDDQLVFIEVKTRTSESYGLPEESIGDKKKEKLHKTALRYLQQKEVLDDNWRIDCIAVVIDQKTKQAQIRHHKNIY